MGLSHRIVSDSDIDRDIADLSRALQEFPQIVDREMGDFGKQARGRLKSEPYPPRRAGQTYVRTGLLANAWSYSPIKMMQHSLLNSAPYSAAVVGSFSQSWVHRGRWWMALPVVARDVPKLLRAILDRFRRELHG